MAEPLGTVVPTSRGERYWPALDGLRAVAVLLVVAQHSHFGLFSGGSIGVGVFFVLSGFLITTVLVEEWERRGRIHVGKFYLRRVLRLYPALLAAILGTFVIAVALGSTTVHQMLKALPAALTYWMNWWLESGHHFVLTDHLWSLSVEEQFYLVWPLLLLCGLAFGRRAAFVGSIVFTAILLVATSVLSTGWDPSRVFYGTDARAPQFLIGAIAALTVARPRRVIRVAAVAGTALLMFVALTPWRWDGLRSVPVLALFSLAAVAVVVCATDPPRWMALVLESKPAVSLGRVSYGVYLWHIPITIALDRHWPNIAPLPLFTVVLIGSVAAAAVSYRFVELPCLRVKRRLV